MLESQFYENDDAFAGRPKLTPDPALRSTFHGCNRSSRAVLRTRGWPKIPKTATRFLRMTLSSGLQADYAALIEKRNMASLHFTKEASASAQELLAVCHDCYDALLATGFSKYIIGSMAAPVRWILRMGGLPSDKQGGIADLQTTAEHGHYLAPFARILLSIAYVREKDKPRAMQLLTGLQQRVSRQFAVSARDCPSAGCALTNVGLLLSFTNRKCISLSWAIHQKFTRL